MTLPLRTTVLLATLALSSCGGSVTLDSTHATGDASNGDAGAGGASSATAGVGGGAGTAGAAQGGCGPVTGSVDVTHVTATAAVSGPEDLSSWQLTAFPLDPSSGGPKEATVTGPGAFQIDGIPCGATFALRMRGGMFGDTFHGPADTWLVTESRTLDLGYSILGRAGAPLGPTTLPLMTGVDAHITGLSPSATANYGEWYCPGSGLAGIGPEGSPMSGEWNEPIHFPVLAPLPQDDDIWLTQLDVGPPGARVVTAGKASGVTFVPDQYAPVDLALTPPPTATFVTTVSTDDFIATVLAATPAATAWYTEVFVGAQPGSQPDATTLAATLAQYDFKPAPGPLTATLTFGNPFPSTTFALVASAGHTAQVVAFAPDGMAFQDSVTTVLVLAYDAAVGATIVPLVSAPTNVSVDGVVPTDSYVAVDLTPTLAWSPPTLGVAALYGVSVTELVPADGGVLQADPKIVSFATTHRSLRIPTGVLQTGHRYTVHVSATSSPADLEHHPFRPSLPMGYADMALPMFIP